MRVVHQPVNMNLHYHSHNRNHNAQSGREQGSMILPSVHENFPLRIGTVQDCNRHNQTISLAEFGKGERERRVMKMSRVLQKTGMMKHEGII
ncbi:hypothetical protein HanIR_Chr02g0072291 [Helianthus annuus]|nr:hypothetical protein HanIR_Chr02g0072291 [Helianthus annuus]